MTLLYYICGLSFMLAFGTTLSYISDLIKYMVTKSHVKVIPIIIQSIFWTVFIISTLLILKQ